MTSLRTTAACALLLFLSAAPALAQPVINPAPVPRDHPRAVRAGALVTLMLEKDRAAVEAYLKEHGADSYAGSAAMKEQLDRILPRLKAKKFVIDRFDQGRGSDVVVIVRDEGGAIDNVVVQVTAEAPHKITGLLRAMIQTAE